MYHQVLDRTVIDRGGLAVWRCHMPGHDDGISQDSWSCYGYPPSGHDRYGRCYCYGCQRSQSIVDIWVYLHKGIFVLPGQRMDDNTRKVYREAFDELDRAGIARNVKPQKEFTGRSFTPVEQSFLTDVADLMYQNLLEDQSALRYINRRGASPLPIMGVARRRQMEDILKLADAYGDPSLTVKTGLSTAKCPEWMHPALQNSIVTFQKDRTGNARYFQSRTLLPDRNQKYYNPKGIAKLPLIYLTDPSAPWFVAEGFFKVAWAARFGWNLWSPLGTDLGKIPTSHMSMLNYGLHMGDNDPNQAGLKGIRNFQMRTEASGLKIVSTLTPRGYKDPDDWAFAIGHAVADTDMRYTLSRGLV
jgi:hypothetical protein